MKHSDALKLENLDAMMDFIEAIFSQLNIGFLIYHLEEPDKAETLKLLYVNEKASEYTGSDLRQLVGKYIHEAFPALTDTEIPASYAEVVRSGEPVTIGTVEYSDINIDRGFYAVRAFPMPHHCVGIVFNNITARKKIDELMKNYSDQLRAENAELHKLVDEISRDMKRLWY